MVEGETSQMGPPQYPGPPKPLCEIKSEEVGTGPQVVRQLQPLKATSSFSKPLIELLAVRYCSSSISGPSRILA